MPVITYEENQNPHLKKVGCIDGRFFVPAYQRGYRWGKHEVETLLNDIYADGRRNNNDYYCLQPVVVKSRPDAGTLGEKADHAAGSFELIDGQQRLTTLYLIYYYLRESDKDIRLQFSLSYDTRPLSTDYLNSLNTGQEDKNIDFFHMYSAYQCIQDWCTSAAKRTKMTPTSVRHDLYRYLQNQIYVIWYDAGKVDSTTLFTRLNVGRIALTNAELIKALLLARRGGDGLDDQYESRQIEISTQWDMIERELQDDAFWAFLTNKPGAAYPTRIEFLFDLIAKKAEDEKDRFYTFLYINKCLNDKTTQQVWAFVLERYQLLREWFEDRDLYHKVGYLIAIGDKLDKLVDETTKGKLTKTSFRTFLENQIKVSLKNMNEASARDLSFETDYEKCRRLLLLFNVESVRRLQHSSERYPFHSHKEQGWSLEHIHAQHAEPLNTEDQWQSWLGDSVRSLTALHLDDSVKETAKQTLVKEINADMAGKVTKPIFTSRSRQVTTFLHAAGTEDAMHSIANLALLSSSVNSALKNAAFQAKRLRVIDRDRAGEFIPICTRRVFFKYYTEAGSQQMHLWTREDQDSYLEEMFSSDKGIGSYLIPVTGVQP